jgi:hypothetical protein
MKKYLITSSQAQASPHSHFWEGLMHYSKRNKAQIIILPMIGRSAVKDQDWQEGNINEIYRPYLEYKRLHLNSNLYIEQFNVRPYQVDPITGLARFAQQGTSLIFASPKQRVMPIAHSHRKYPKMLITTGACTRPNYATQDEVSAERRRLGDIARRDHLFGAIVVEVINDEIFHFRHLRANHEGVFVDLGVIYDGNKTREAHLEAMIMGDYHFGQSDPVVIEASKKMIAELQPKRLVLHDYFDGHSVNHHLEKKPVREKLIQIYDKHLHLLDRELKDGQAELMELNELMEGREIALVFSNHHTFLHRYLEEGRFSKDLPNFRTAAELLRYMADRDYNDPVQAGYNKYGKLPRNIKFLREDQDYKVHGYQLGAHGDHNWAAMGYDSMLGNETNFGKSIVGHSHSIAILRNCYRVGTCLPLNQFYMRGFPSKWSHTHALLWNTGTVQMISIINGQWRA